MHVVGKHCLHYVLIIGIYLDAKQTLAGQIVGIADESAQTETFPVLHADGTCNAYSSVFHAVDEYGFCLFVNVVKLEQIFHNHAGAPHYDGGKDERQRQLAQPYGHEPVVNVETES